MDGVNSYGRPVHVVSRTNWAGVGVKPGIETLLVQAFNRKRVQRLMLLDNCRPSGAACKVCLFGACHSWGSLHILAATIRHPRLTATGTRR